MTEKRNTEKFKGAWCCGGCGRRIRWWQQVILRDLSENPVRSAITDAPFHPRCWTRFPEGAK